MLVRSWHARAVLAYSSLLEHNRACPGVIELQATRTPFLASLVVPKIVTVHRSSRSQPGKQQAQLLNANTMHLYSMFHRLQRDSRRLSGKLARLKGTSGVVGNEECAGAS